MSLTEEQIEKIINFGAFEYSNQKMANILDVDVKIVVKQMNDVNALFYKSYQKGKDRADYVIDLKLFEMAITGDIKAINKLEMRKIVREN